MFKYTKNTKNEDLSAIECMRKNMDTQDDAELGFFWYDPTSDELFGVTSTPASALKFYHNNVFDIDVRTDLRLHKTVWEKEFFRKKDRRFLGDYTKVPRGRVFEFKDSGYVVYTGSWINQYPQVKEQILFEFNLPQDTEFRVDHHCKYDAPFLAYRSTKQN